MCPGKVCRTNPPQDGGTHICIKGPFSGLSRHSTHANLSSGLPPEESEYETSGMGRYPENTKEASVALTLNDNAFLVSRATTSPDKVQSLFTLS